MFKLLIILLLLSVNSFAQNEFNSETIEDGEFGLLNPLPPELVEESELSQEEKEILEIEQEIISKAENDNNSSTQSLTSTQKDQIKNALNGSDIEIAALIKTFSKILRRNYIIDGSVKGKVTIHLPTPLTTNEALKVFDTILLLKGFATIPVTKGTWKVIKAQDAKQTTVPFVKASSKSPSDQLVTEKVRLKHVSASEANNLISSFISKAGIIKPVESNNSLIIIDSQANINRLRELLGQVDVPAVDREITIVPITHAEASDIAEKINEILGGDSESNQNQASNVRSNTNSTLNRLRRLRQRTNSTNQSNNNNNSEEKRTIPFKIIPDERTNSLIVVADKEMTIKVRELVSQLDSEVDRSSGRFWVYKLQHSDAESLSEIINNLISGATSSDTNGRRTQGSSLTRSNNNNNLRNNNRANNARNALTRNNIRNAANNAGNSRVNFEGEVSITADPATNSLLINASKGDYSRIRDVIDQLDIKRRQVLVEATILEVRLSDQDGFGIELQGTAGLEDNGGIFGQSNFGSITNLLTNPAALTDITLAAASAGTLTLPGGITIPSQAVLVSAVSQNTNVNVLSSPTILATDNEEAEIIVGENVPFVSSTSTNQTNIANTFNQVQRQDVGITLRITPQISSGEYVNLRIFVEISSVVEGTRADQNGPTTTIRTSETAVEVRDAQMVITGGLLQDQLEDSTSGFPILEDIPILGNLFQTQNKINSKTNLLILITPKIIKDQYDARENTKLYAEAVRKEIEKFEIQPNREEVLSSPSLDNVAEEYKGDVAKPSTILPAIENLNNDDTINLVVAPRLPSSHARASLKPQATAIEKLPLAKTIPSNSTENLNTIRDISRSNIGKNESTRTETALSDIPLAKTVDTYAGDTPGEIPIAQPVQTDTFKTLEHETLEQKSAQDQLSKIIPQAELPETNNILPPARSGYISVLKELNTGQTIALSSSNNRLDLGKSYFKNNQEYICLGVYENLDTLRVAHPQAANEITTLEQWDSNE